MAVGGLLLGGVGAVIGGLSGSTRTAAQVQRIDLRLVMNSLDEPVFVVNFFDRANAFGGAPGVAREEARLWFARIKVIVERGDSIQEKTVSPTRDADF